ncbi:hypothetical protein HZH68_000072 [Vespula germanica]|uniref:Uncharacterized protein n=1 Tax=Vespula germanica TaxID=30212 RepID=A0A834NSX1_VESGE|nr:hypothetical protein HZH68_000072 [Vespula germanica]
MSRGDPSTTTESGHRLDSGSPFWRIQLDQDLLDTISAIYPEWFKDYTNGRASTSSSTSTSGPRSNNGSNVAADSSGVLEHKVAKGDSKLKAKSKRADNFKEKDRERKDARRDNRDERDAGNGKKSTTKASPQQDKTTVDVAGRKTAGVPVSGAEMAEGNQSPPKAEVDDSPLQHAMDRNKESSLKLSIEFPENVQRRYEIRRKSVSTCEYRKADSVR